MPLEIGSSTLVTALDFKAPRESIDGGGCRGQVSTYGDRILSHQPWRKEVVVSLFKGTALCVLLVQRWNDESMGVLESDTLDVNIDEDVCAAVIYAVLFGPEDKLGWDHPMTPDGTPLAIVERLGRGATSAVYRAVRIGHDSALTQTLENYALKALSGHRPQPGNLLEYELGMLNKLKSLASELDLPIPPVPKHWAWWAESACW